MLKYFLAVPDPNIEIMGALDHNTSLHVFFFYLESYIINSISTISK